MDLSVRDTVNGKGIFVERAFVSGEDLYEVTGEFVSGDEDDDMDDSVRSNTFRYDEDRYISPRGQIGDFQNHSCEPNARVVKRDKRLFVVAHSDIPAGAEILIDYSTIIASDDVWEMDCACRSDACRGIVKRFVTLPRVLRQRYTREGIVPEYILEI